jgi:hypothetical protein
MSGLAKRLLKDPKPVPPPPSGRRVLNTVTRPLAEIEFADRVSLFRTLLRSIILAFTRPTPETTLRTFLPNDRYVETHRVSDGPGPKYATYCFASRWGFEFLDRAEHDSLSAAYEGHAAFLRRYGTD